MGSCRGVQKSCLPRTFANELSRTSSNTYPRARSHLTTHRTETMPTMKAWQASAYGADGNPADTIANLKLADVEIPPAGAGQIQVKVSLAAINPIDWIALLRGSARHRPLHVPLRAWFRHHGRGHRRRRRCVFPSTLHHSFHSHPIASFFRVVRRSRRAVGFFARLTELT